MTGAFEAAGRARRPGRTRRRRPTTPRRGRNVIISTGPASGKSLGYLLPALTGVLDGRHRAVPVADPGAGRRPAADAVRRCGIPGVRAAVVDGDTPAGERDWARAHASYLLTTPDMLHHSLLPRHARWDGFFRRLSLRDRGRVPRLPRRVRLARGAGAAPAAPGRGAPRAGPERPGSAPVFVLASATISEPENCARLLTGLDAAGGDRGRRPARAAHVRAVGAAAHRRCAARRARRSAARATAEAAGLLADLVTGGIPALAFVRSRRGAEAVALGARRSLAEAGAAGLARPGGGLPVRLPAARSGGPWRRACARARSPAWPPPPRWSWGSTSAAWTRC